MATVAQFDVTYTQFLNEQGNLTGEIPAFAKDPTLLKELYKIMVLTRTFDKKAIALQRTGKMGTYDPINGQEAVSTAIGHAMQAEDILIPYYRDYAAQIQRGVKMSEILSYWGGDERGSNFSKNAQDLPICVPIASQCLHATGVAFAFQSDPAIWPRLTAREIRSRPRSVLYFLDKEIDDCNMKMCFRNRAIAWRTPLSPFVPPSAITATGSLGCHSPPSGP